MSDSAADDEPTPSALEHLAGSAPEIAASAAGGLLGYAIGGPVGAAAGNAAGPAMLAAWQIGNTALLARLTRGSQILDLAAAHLNTDLDGLTARGTEDPARLELLARVLEAAGRTPLPEKLPALARVLANGLDPTGKVDDAFILAAAIDDIEAPHLQVLQLLAELDEDNGPPATTLSTRDIADLLPGHKDVLSNVLRTLDRHWLAADPEPGSLDGGSVATLHDPTSSAYAITDLGRRCLYLLQTKR